MKVKDVMTVDPRTATPETNLAEAAASFLDADCGMLPVVEHGRLTGVVTDRDICIALGTRNARASELAVGAVARSPVWTCAPDEDVHVALTTMKQHRVRRLPVVGFGDTVVGVVSMNDILLAAGPRKAVESKEVIDVLQAICAHAHPAAHIAVA
jgi:CBS domain-containing protein